MRTLVAVLATLWLVACSLGPEYQRPSFDVPEAFRDETKPGTGASLGEVSWWDVYKDEQLQQLLRAALEQNRDAKIALARVSEARAQLGAAGLARWPQANVAASGLRGRVFQGGDHVTGALFSAEGQVSFELDLWRRLASLNEAARANLLASEHAHDAVIASLIGDVATGYFSLLSLDQQLRITEHFVETRQRFLDLTRRKFSRGASSGLDVSRAEANLAVARATVPDLKRQIAQTENQLHILLGENPSAVPRRSVDLQALPALPDVPPGLPSALLERRPDLRQAEQSLIAATANVRAAKAALFPTIALTGSFGWESVELTQLFLGPAKVWSLGLNVLQPLINAERSRYQVEAARARTEQALLQYQSAVTNAFREVSDALEARREFSEQLREQERQVQALREASARVLRRYEVGYSSYFEVIDADSSLFTSELQMVQVYRNNLVALVALYKALGGGWQTGSTSQASG